MKTRLDVLFMFGGLILSMVVISPSTSLSSNPRVAVDASLSGSLTASYPLTEIFKGVINIGDNVGSPWYSASWSGNLTLVAVYRDASNGTIVSGNATGTGVGNYTSVDPVYGTCKWQGALPISKLSVTGSTSNGPTQWHLVLAGTGMVTPTCTLSPLGSIEIGVDAFAGSSSLWNGATTSGANYVGVSYSSSLCTDGTGRDCDASYTIALEWLTQTTVSCGPQPVSVGGHTYCNVFVSDVFDALHPVLPNTPNGVVRFVSDGSGSFDGTPPGTCTLYQSYGYSGENNCQVTYVPGAVGTGHHNITAYYSGDSKILCSAPCFLTSAHAPSKGSTIVTVQPSTGVTTQLSVACAPSSLDVGAFSTCTVTVTGSSPSGDVTLSSNSVTGVFSPTGKCTLSATGICSVAFTDTVASSPTVLISASYPGNARNMASTGTSSLTLVKPSKIIAVTVSPVTISRGTATADHTSTTGVAVHIFGSSAVDGTPLVVATKVLSSPGTSVGTINLAGIKYFDVLINGANSGTAKVCISYPAATSITTMQYWTGTAWTAAANINVNGATVCGSMPVSALAGTNIAVGNSFQPASSPQLILGLNPTLFYEVVLGLTAVIVIGLAILMTKRRRTSRPSVR